MIFYFSGTGNSLYAAKTIAEAQGETMLSIPKEIDKRDAKLQYELMENEILGFVFPVYSWAPPKIVLDFISRMNVTGGRPFVFSLCTCAGVEGRTAHVMERALKRKGLLLNAAFSLQMPANNMMSHDVEKEYVAHEKLQNAEKRLKEINTALEKRQPGVFNLNPGKLPAFKTLIISRLFNQFGRNTKKFYATDACIHCGLCEKVCPIHTITVKEKPVWGASCTRCLACINRCPLHAIQFGNETIQRRRYLHPAITDSSILGNVIK